MAAMNNIDLEKGFCGELEKTTTATEKKVNKKGRFIAGFAAVCAIVLVGTVILVGAGETDVSTRGLNWPSGDWKSVLYRFHQKLFARKTSGKNKALEVSESEQEKKEAAQPALAQGTSSSIHLQYPKLPTSFEDIETAPAEVSRSIDTSCESESLGEGQFGTVFPGTGQFEGKAIKRIAIPETESESERMLVEILSMMKLTPPREGGGHRGFVTLHQAYRDLQYVFLVMDRCDGGTLRAYIDRCRGLSEEEAARITIQLCDAIEFMHEHGIVHCDLHSGNILLVGDPSKPDVKIIDFGLARLAGFPDSRTPKANADDIRFLGKAVYRMLYNPDNHDIQNFDIFGYPDGSVFRDFPANPTVSDSAKGFFTEMLQQDPSRRPNAEKCLKLAECWQRECSPGSVPISIL